MRKINLAKDNELKIVLKHEIPAMFAQALNVLYTIINRLVHHSSIIKITGISYRILT